MHGLLSRLAGIDSAAERGLRVIEFFDQLVAHRADVEAVTRATAVLAESTAGCILDDGDELCSVTPDGQRVSTAGPGPQALVQDVVLDDEVVGRVWLEHPDSAGEHEWDELILARMALTLATLRAAGGRPEQLGLADPALLHVLIRDAAAEADAARAARLLGFTVGQRVRVVAVVRADGVEPVLVRLRRSLAAATGARTVAAAISATLAVVIVATDGPVEVPLPEGTTACSGPAGVVEQAALSWAQARDAVRFARPGPRSAWVDVDDLGCVVALAGLPADTVERLPDVQAVARLAARRSGEDDLALLDALCLRPSIREAGAALHMHHSSVAYRVEKISGVVGFDVRTPHGRYRARTALLLWRLTAGLSRD